MISGQITFPSGIEQVSGGGNGNGKSASSAVMHLDRCKKLYCFLSPEHTSSPQRTFCGSVRFGGRGRGALEIYVFILVLGLDYTSEELSNPRQKFFRSQVMNTKSQRNENWQGETEIKAEKMHSNPQTLKRVLKKNQELSLVHDIGHTWGNGGVVPGISDHVLVWEIFGIDAATSFKIWELSPLSMK